jgi:hypothetical protein
LNRAALEIVVDELVVRGLPPGDARVAAAAFEARLATLAGAAEAAVPERGEAFRRLAPVSAPGGSPAAVGEAVAGAVWNAVSGGGER